MAEGHTVSSPLELRILVDESAKTVDGKCMQSYDEYNLVHFEETIYTAFGKVMTVFPYGRTY